MVQPIYKVNTRPSGLIVCRNVSNQGPSEYDLASVVQNTSTNSTRRNSTIKNIVIGALTYTFLANVARASGKDINEYKGKPEQAIAPSKQVYSELDSQSGDGSSDGGDTPNEDQRLKSIANALGVTPSYLKNLTDRLKVAKQQNFLRNGFDGVSFDNSKKSNKTGIAYIADELGKEVNEFGHGVGTLISILGDKSVNYTSVDERWKKKNRPANEIIEDIGYFLPDYALDRFGRPVHGTVVLNTQEAWKRATTKRASETRLLPKAHPKNGDILSAILSLPYNLIGDTIEVGRGVSCLAENIIWVNGEEIVKTITQRIPEQVTKRPIETTLHLGADYGVGNYAANQRHKKEHRRKVIGTVEEIPPKPPEWPNGRSGGD